MGFYVFAAIRFLYWRSDKYDFLEGEGRDSLIDNPEEMALPAEKATIKFTLIWDVVPELLIYIGRYGPSLKHNAIIYNQITSYSSPVSQTTESDWYWVQVLLAPKPFPFRWENDHMPLVSNTAALKDLIRAG